MMDIEGEGIDQSVHFSTQVGDCFTLSQEHALRLSYNEKDEPAPYIHVRNGMEAKLNRSVYYEFVDHLIELEDSVPKDKQIKQSGHSVSSIKQDGLPAMGVWSAGRFFIF